jgi:hypothetical protein
MKVCVIESLGNLLFEFWEFKDLDLFMEAVVFLLVWNFLRLSSYLQIVQESRNLMPKDLVEDYLSLA